MICRGGNFVHKAWHSPTPQSGTLWYDGHTTYHAVIYIYVFPWSTALMLEMEIPYELWLLLKNYSFRGELNCRISEWHQLV